MSDLLAKSDGETLLRHTSHVIEISQRLCLSLPFSPEERDELARTLKRIAALHDLGKAATGFQDALLEPGGKGSWGRRHEIISAAYASLWMPEVSAAELLAIITHHRNLPTDSGMRGERCLPENELPYEERAEWRQMCREFEDNREKIEHFAAQVLVEHGEQWPMQWQTPVDFGAMSEQWVRRQFQPGHIDAVQRRRASLLRGLLISSDHMASGHIKPSRVGNVPLLCCYKRRIFRHELRGQALLPFQEKCGSTCGSVILKAPTGSGKTLAIFLWAAHNQAENGRFFYVLPHTASLNAMHGRLRRIFGMRHCGILHHKNAAYLFRLLAGDDTSLAVKQKIKKSRAASGLAKLAREMYYPIRATTPHQLLRGALKGQGWELALSEFPNACFVFDEIHAFEPKLFGLTVAMAKWLHGMGARLMFASATLPKFAEDILRHHLDIPEENVLVPNAKDKLDATVLDKKRHRIEVKAGTMLEYLPRIIKYLQENEHTALLVCNHVNTSQMVFAGLQKYFGADVMLLHARFNSEDRNRIEKDITSKKPPRILVATQAVEVSLDLDYNCGFIEPAPADALGQRLGRINRKGSAPQPATVVVFEQAVGGELYDETLTGATVAQLKQLPDGGVLTEQGLTNVVNTIYAHGYPPEAHKKFQQGLSNPSLKNFDSDIIAGTHHDWLEHLLEKSDGQVELLPIISTDAEGNIGDMKERYQSLLKQGRYLEARQLLVPVRIGQFFGLKNKGVLHFDEKLKEWTTTQKYSTLTGLDLSNQIDSLI
jgi:CRISPR-associated endonuclease/helicase Cas3